MVLGDATLSTVDFERPEHSFIDFTPLSSEMLRFVHFRR